MNTIIQGDNLDTLKMLQRDYGGQVGLIYTDPPFATNNIFRMDDDRANTISMASKSALAYDDTLRGEAYLNAIEERLKAAYLLLSNTGSLYLHIDCKVAYDIKIILDKIFGPGSFRNSISRIKSNPKNFSQDGYGSVKDTILFYTKSKQFTWNEPRRAPTERRLKQFNKEDERGKYDTAPLHAPGETLDGDTGKEWMGRLPPKGRHWRRPPKELDELERQGLIVWSRTGNPRMKVYAKDVIERGVLLQDVWEFKDPQYPSYPTEKNLEMLESIVRASSNPGDMVLDFCCGSGTTLLAAAKHGRNFIGIDRSPKAIECAVNRLDGYEFETRALLNA